MLDTGMSFSDTGGLGWDSSMPFDTSSDTAQILGNLLYLDNYNSSAETVEVWLRNNEPIAGFQADLSGANVDSGTGGAAETAGLDVYASSGNTFLGVSLALGEVDVDANGQHLTTLSLSSVTGTELCLSNEILSDKVGIAIPSDVGPCLPL